MVVRDLSPRAPVNDIRGMTLVAVAKRKAIDHLRSAAARRASICLSMSGDFGVDAVDPAERVRGQELVMVGEMPVERSAQLILLFALPG
jgi:hypothetical protein